MKLSCRGMTFNLITETEKSSKKHNEAVLYKDLASSSVFLSFIHDFRRLYPKKL